MAAQLVDHQRAFQRDDSHVVAVLGLYHHDIAGLDDLARIVAENQFAGIFEADLVEVAVFVYGDAFQPVEVGQFAAAVVIVDFEGSIGLAFHIAASCAVITFGAGFFENHSQAVTWNMLARLQKVSFGLTLLSTAESTPSRALKAFS